MPVALAPELAAALQAARSVELAADGGLSRTRMAVEATARLMAAAADAGWPIVAMAHELGLAPSAARARVRRARGAGLHSLGIEVPPAPRRPDRTIAPEQRDWLTASEAANYASISMSSLADWRRYGLLPNVDPTMPTRLLYFRLDLDQVVASRRRQGGQVDRVAVLAALTAGGHQ